LDAKSDFDTLSPDFKLQGRDCFYMSSEIKSLTPKVVREFVRSAILSRWDGDKDWEKVDVEIRSFNYLGIGQSSEPLEFSCRIYSRQRFSWVYALSIKDIFDVMAPHLEKSIDSQAFRCEAGRYEMMRVPGTDDFSIDFEIKIVDSENYTGNLRW
jgi:hypothetical protein